MLVYYVLFFTFCENLELFKRERKLIKMAEKQQKKKKNKIFNSKCNLKEVKYCRGKTVSHGFKKMKEYTNGKKPHIHRLEDL